MIDTELLRGILTAVVSGAILSMAGFIFRYISRQIARNNRNWLIGIILIVLVAGLLYGAYLEKISLLWVLGGLLIVAFSYGIYRRYFDFPLRKWRVTNNRGTEKILNYKEGFITKDQKHNPGLLAFNSDLEGIPIGKAWMFKTNKPGIAVYGPYILSLDPGRYKAIFKLKIMIGTEDIRIEGKEARSPLGKLRKTDKIDIVRIDVVSCNDQGCGKVPHSEKILHNHLFNKANKYEKTKINFEIEREEAPIKGLEMRIDSLGHGHIVVLDYIKLSRRLF